MSALELNSVLSPTRTQCAVSGVSKKRLFELASRFVSDDQPSLTAKEVYNKLLAREKLGSTALGNGIAIPHCRISNCQRALATLITLSEPVDFDAPDGQKVDIIFMLLVPEEAHEEHLNILAGLARLLSDDTFCRGLRAAENAHELFHAAVDFQASD
jgi:PTS system nitrogen regulatory IIA component